MYLFTNICSLAVIIVNLKCMSEEEKKAEVNLRKTNTYSSHLSDNACAGGGLVAPS